MSLINAYSVLHKAVILTHHSYWLMAENWQRITIRGGGKQTNLALRSKVVRGLSKAQNTSFVKPDIPTS